ncbi:hypothetical protein ACROYT_G014229 [Oculina patagonica]
MRRMYIRAKKLVTNKKQVLFIMHAVAVCVNATSMSQLTEYVRALLLVLGNEYIHQEVEDAYKQLKEGINSLENPTKKGSASEVIAGEDVPLDRSADLGQEETNEEKALRRSPTSPFACHFQSLWKKDQSNSKQASEKNWLYLPNLCKTLLEEYLPTAPLWCGILLPYYINRQTGDDKSHITRLTSGKMENSIKALKEEDFNGEKRLPLHIYARKRYQMILGRQRLFFKGVMRAKRKVSKPTKGQVSCLGRSLNLPESSKKNRNGTKIPRPIQEKRNKKIKVNLSKSKKFPHIGRFQQSPLKPLPDNLHDITSSRSGHLVRKEDHKKKQKGGKPVKRRVSRHDDKADTTKAAKYSRLENPGKQQKSVLEDFVEETNHQNADNKVAVTHELTLSALEQQDASECLVKIVEHFGNTKTLKMEAEAEAMAVAMAVAVMAEFKRNASDLESGTGDDESNTTVETSYDVRVHDEDLSSNTNEEVGQGCSEIAKRKLELQVEEVKPDI